MDSRFRGNDKGDIEIASSRSFGTRNDGGANIRGREAAPTEKSEQ